MRENFVPLISSPPRALDEVSETLRYENNKERDGSKPIFLNHRRDGSRKILKERLAKAIGEDKGLGIISGGKRCEHDDDLHSRVERWREGVNSPAVCDSRIAVRHNPPIDSELSRPTRSAFSRDLALKTLHSWWICQPILIGLPMSSIELEQLT